MLRTRRRFCTPLSWDGEAPRTFLKLPESTSLDRSLEADPQIPMAYSEDGSQALVVLGPGRISNYLNGTLAWWPAFGESLVLSSRIPVGRTGRATHTVLRLCAIRARERRIEIRSPTASLERTIFRTAGGISFLRFSPHEDSVAFLSSLFHEAILREKFASQRRMGSPPRPLTPRFAFCRGLAWNAKTGRSGSRYRVTARRPERPQSRDALGKISRRVLPCPETSFFRTSPPRGDLCLLTSSENRTAPDAPSGGGNLQDFSWFNQTFVTDISPDGKSLLFYDGGLEVPFGSWIRSVDGGDAVRLE